MKCAVCVLIQVSPDEYLTVSRRGSTTAWGLPGGKIDRHFTDDNELAEQVYETAVEALIREAREEINVELEPSELMPVFTGVCEGEQTFLVTTFVAKEGVSLIGMRPEDGLTISKHTLQDLCDPMISPFAAYNAELTKAISAL